MKKNTLLSIASLACKLINAIILITIITATALFIHFQLDKSAYQNWDFIDQKSGSSIISLESKIDYSKNSETVSPQKPNFINFSTLSLYFNYIKFTVSASLIFMSIRLFGKVIASVKNRKTFENINAFAFKRIGIYCFIIGITSSYDYYDFETQYKLTRISLNLTFFIIALIALVLSEIFKEGNKLKLESDLTI